MLPIIDNEMTRIFSAYRQQYPTAISFVNGNENNSSIEGEIFFYQLEDGVYIRAYIIGLPKVNSKGESVKFYGFHIQENSNCTQDSYDELFPFNPNNNQHSFYAGDFPPILSANGVGILSVFTNNFTVNNIVEKSIVIHEGINDFTYQPSGNVGKNIACGVILPYHY